MSTKRLLEKVVKVVLFCPWSSLVDKDGTVSLGWFVASLESSIIWHTNIMSCIRPFCERKRNISTKKLLEKGVKMVLFCPWSSFVDKDGMVCSKLRIEHFMA
jgi:hypothetical protein